jgi:hypothetical protein
MDLSKGESEPQIQAVNFETPGNRRGFLRALAGGIAIAIPAFGVLAGATPANAASSAYVPCTLTHFVVTYECPGYGIGCPSGFQSTCLATVAEVDNRLNIVCQTWTLDIGPCGSDSCPDVKNNSDTAGPAAAC